MVASATMSTAHQSPRCGTAASATARSVASYSSEAESMRLASVMKRAASCSRRRAVTSRKTTDTPSGAG
jgi:hypothetical protein